MSAVGLFGLEAGVADRFPPAAAATVEGEEEEREPRARDGGWVLLPVVASGCVDGLAASLAGAAFEAASGGEGRDDGNGDGVAATVCNGREAAASRGC